MQDSDIIKNALSKQPTSFSKFRNSLKWNLSDTISKKLPEESFGQNHCHSSKKKYNSLGSVS